MQLSGDERSKTFGGRALPDRSNELLGCARRRNGLMIPTLRRMLWVVCDALHVNYFVHRDLPQTPPPPKSSNSLPSGHNLGAGAIAHPHSTLCSATHFKSQSQRGLTRRWGDRRLPQNFVPRDDPQTLCSATMFWVMSRQRLGCSDDPTKLRCSLTTKLSGSEGAPATEGSAGESLGVFDSAPQLPTLCRLAPHFNQALEGTRTVRWGIVVNPKAETAL
jgi:hypothetical protein